MTMEHPAVEDVFPNENGSSNVMLVFRSVITCVLSWIEVILVDPQNKSQSEVGRFDVHEFNESTLISHKPGLCKKRLISILDVRSSFSFRINMARSKKTAMQLTNSLQKSYVVTEATSQTQKSFNCPFPFQQWIWHTPTSTQLLLHLTFFSHPTPQPGLSGKSRLAGGSTTSCNWTSMDTMKLRWMDRPQRWI